MKQKTACLLLFLLTAGALHAEMDIPESGRIRIDGKLSDWRRAEWTPINAVITGTPTGISNAVWSLAWDEDGTVFVAVQYDDADIVLRNSTNLCDCIELYARGDTGSDSQNFYPSQTSAQSYLFGLRDNQPATWLQMGPFQTLPSHNPIEVAITLDGSRFIYEAAIRLYDTFDANDANRCSESELYSDKEIGFDIAIIDIGATGTGGILGSNARKKRSAADAISTHRLEE